MKQINLLYNKLVHRVVASAFVSCVACDALAAYQGHQPGPLLNTGKVTDQASLMTIVNNPASGELLIDDDENFRMGYLSSIGGSYEIGDLNNVEDDIEELEDLLDDENLTLDKAIDAVDKFQALLPKYGDRFNFAIEVGVHVPFFPMALRSEGLGGVLGFDLSNATLADVRFLDAPIEIVRDGNDISLRTDSALYVKAANLWTARLGYSREVWEPPVKNTKLYAGLNLNFFRAQMNKQVVSFQAAAEDSNEDIGDIVKDEFEENTASSSAIGLDLGVLWSLPFAQLGLTIANINEPEFDYGAIGVNCSQFTGLRQKNCLAAQGFANEISLSEKATLNAQTTLEAAVFSKNRVFSFSGSYDLNSAYNLVARKSQILSGTIGIFPNNAIPNMRFSLNKNLAGTKLTKVGFGTTLFGIMNIDLVRSLDKITSDGEEIPRYFGFNIGFEEKF